MSRFKPISYPARLKADQDTLRYLRACKRYRLALSTGKIPADTPAPHPNDYTDRRKAA